MVPGEPKNYTLRADLHRGTLVIYLGGQLTLDNANDLNRGILTSIPRNDPFLVLDLSEVSYADSSGLSLLFSVQSKVVRAGGRMAMTGLHGHLREVMSVSNYYAVFAVSETLDAAVDFIEAEKKSHYMRETDGPGDSGNAGTRDA